MSSTLGTLNDCTRAPGGLDPGQAAEFLDGQIVGHMAKTLIHELAHRQARHHRPTPSGPSDAAREKAGRALYDTTHVVIHWLAYEAACELADEIKSKLNGGTADLPPDLGGASDEFLKGVLAGLCCSMKADESEYADPTNENARKTLDSAIHHLSEKLDEGPPFVDGNPPYGMPSDDSTNPDNPLPPDAFAGFPGNPGDPWPPCDACAKLHLVIGGGDQ